MYFTFSKSICKELLHISRLLIGEFLLSSKGSNTECRVSRVEGKRTATPAPLVPCSLRLPFSLDSRHSSLVTFISHDTSCTLIRSHRNRARFGWVSLRLCHLLYITLPLPLSRLAAHPWSLHFLDIRRHPGAVENGLLRPIGTKLRGREREPGIKTKMRVKLAAKLLIIAWTLMKKKEPFNPDYLNIE